EKAPVEESGGNARLSHTGFRVPVSGIDEVALFLPDISAEERDRLVVEPYTAEALLGDLHRPSAGGAEPVMARTLAYGANEAVHWMREQGVRWALNRAVADAEGRLHFEPGMALQTGPDGTGGLGQLEDWARIAAGLGIEVRHEAGVV